MSLILRFTDDGFMPSFSRLQLDRSLENAFGQIIWQTHDDLGSRKLDEITVVQDNTIRFRGVLEVVEGNRYTGYTCSARSATVGLEKVQALGSESYSKSTLVAVCRAICAQAGVTLGAVPDRVINRVRADKGQTFRELLQSIAEIKQVVLTDDAFGRARMYDAPQEPASRVWTEPGLRQPIALRLDYTQWVEEWLCRGYRVLNSEDVAELGGAGLRTGTRIGSSVPRSRRVLPNRAAASQVEAGALIDWTAKKELAKVVGVTVIHSEWSGDTGDLVRIRARVFGIDADMIVESVSANFVESEYRYQCVFPDVYRAMIRMRAQVVDAPVR